MRKWLLYSSILFLFFALHAHAQSPSASGRGVDASSDSGAVAAQAVPFTLQERKVMVAHIERMAVLAKDASLIVSLLTALRGSKDLQKGEIALLQEVMHETFIGADSILAAWRAVEASNVSTEQRAILAKLLPLETCRVLVTARMKIK